MLKLLTLQSCAGAYYFLTEVHKTEELSWLSLTSVLVYIAAFSIGWGPVPWIMMSELLPSKTRGASSGICNLINWNVSFLVTKEFSDLETAITDYGAFWLFAGINFAGFIYVLFLVPETKGKTLEEIEVYFEGGQATEERQPLLENA